MGRKNNIKIHWINNLKRDFNKILSEDPVSLIQDALNHPATKLAIYNSHHSDLYEPHTKNEIKTKIEFEGNDKELREILNPLEIDFEGEKLKPKLFFKSKHPRGDMRVTQYQMLPADKIQTHEAWVWETVEGCLGINKENVQKLVEQEVHNEVKALQDIRKYLKSLPEEERIAEIEQFKKEIKKQYPKWTDDSIKGYTDFLFKDLLLPAD
jgi:hypothetical protein